FGGDDLLDKALSTGCFDLSSNVIRVTRVAEEPCDAAGGTLTGGPFEFTVGDGVADMIPEGAITVANSNGENFQWVITDEAGTILGLPENYADVDFEGAGTGTCLVWYLRYNGEISGLERDLNANDLRGCFSLSNPISVVRGSSNASETVITNAIDRFTAKEQLELRLYPNPTIDRLVIQLENSELLSTESYIRIFSGSGTLVRQLVSSEELQIELNVSDLPTGIYLLQLNNGSTVTTRK
ncbi:MAG: T9SS type A sorting domain-containing protein, partial [Bacteroidota bacterium]